MHGLYLLWLPVQSLGSFILEFIAVADPIRPLFPLYSFLECHFVIVFRCVNAEKHLALLLYLTDLVFQFNDDTILVGQLFLQFLNLFLLLVDVSLPGRRFLSVMADTCTLNDCGRGFSTLNVMELLPDGHELGKASTLKISDSLDGFAIEIVLHDIVDDCISVLLYLNELQEQSVEGDVGDLAELEIVLAFFQKSQTIGEVQCLNLLQEQTESKAELYHVQRLQ